MADDKDFRDRVRQLGERVEELESIGDPAVRAKAKELVQLLMEMHGSAVERMLEVIFHSSDAGAKVIDKLGEDPLVGSLLILYGLHPEDVQTRVEKKMKQVRSQLFKMGAEVTSLTVEGLEEPSPSGFVAMDSLIGSRSSLVPASSSTTGLDVSGSD